MEQNLSKRKICPNELYNYNVVLKTLKLCINKVKENDIVQSPNFLIIIESEMTQNQIFIT